ncbi:MAG: hypothetical protein ACREDM_07440 [Methylocella sp.]
MRALELEHFGTASASCRDAKPRAQLAAIDSWGKPLGADIRLKVNYVSLTTSVPLHRSGKRESDNGPKSLSSRDFLSLVSRITPELLGAADG